jgi:hypothetical protein
MVNVWFGADIIIRDDVTTKNDVITEPDSRNEYSSCDVLVIVVRFQPKLTWFGNF